MKSRWIMAAGACALGFGVVTSAAGLQDQNGWMQRRFSGVMIRRTEGQLALTEVQRTQIREILQAEKPRMIALAEKAEQERVLLDSHRRFDESYVRAFARQHASTMEDAMVEREKVRLAIWQILTPEQQQTADRIRADLRARFFERLSTVGDQL
jgi:Spy/CpxP family protein refolding chaperone